MKLIIFLVILVGGGFLGWCFYEPGNRSSPGAIIWFVTIIASIGIAATDTRCYPGKKHLY